MPAPNKILNPQKLTEIAHQVRRDIIRMLFKAGSGHSAGSLGMADVLTALYFAVLNHDPDRPKWPDRDRLVLSNGHICPALYAVLSRAGYFKTSELQTLRKLGSRLQGHPSRLDLPGIENSSGPLGQGISMAIGICLAAKLNQKKHDVYCLMGDGEQNEGQVWEAYLFAGKYQLDNLTVIIDRNSIQLDGYTKDIMPLEPLKAKLEAFNFHVLEIDGHNFENIIDACHQAKAIFTKPVAIISYTIPGKGVEEIEFDPGWHGKVPDKKQAEIFLKQLKNNRLYG